MSDDNQNPLPRSFIELFIAPGKLKPSEPRHVIEARYEWCEDMAQMLTEQAGERLFSLHITERDVLERMHRGLLVDGAVVSPAEAHWIVCRLAELMGWAPPASQALA